MEDIKHKMPMHKRIFFTNLENYLGKPLYYFGSIQRYDYSPETSDIDAILFTNNESSSISQLQNWFQVSKHDFKRVVKFLTPQNRIVYGHKLKYKNEKQNISTDISIYNVKDEENIKRDDKRKIDMPFYLVTMMVMLKFIYYQVGILPKQWYMHLKQLLMDIVDDGVDFLKIKSHTWKFVIFDIPKKKLEEVT
jgi:hypothetical protein